MRRDRRALAGLFDALIFLAIASLVSVSLLSAIGVSHDDGRRDHRVDAVHTALLRSTVDDSMGNPCSVQDLFKLEVVGPKDHEEEISSVLELLLIGKEWRWSVIYGERSWSYGTDTVPDDTVRCSVVRAPFNGSFIEYRLEVWNHS
ncbi:MAG: hypothetical protein SA339_10560 [Methanomassiliicoccus sp.]|nr:hypothetical protein [Methanomassiliicoccus sp.]